MEEIDERDRIKIMLDPSGELLGFGYNLKYVDPNDINYFVDYTEIPFKYRRYISNYLNRIRTTYEGDNPPSNSLLDINMYRQLSDINNNRTMSIQQKKEEVKKVKDNLVNVVENYERNNNDYRRSILMEELFGTNSDNDELDYLRTTPIETEFLLPSSNRNDNIINNMFDKLIKPTNRRIADQAIINKNIDKKISKKEEEQLIKLQAAARRATVQKSRTKAATGS